MPIADRTALVTGTTGFIASHLVPALLGAGWQVRTTGRRRRPGWLPPDVPYEPADLTEDEGLEDLVREATHVFHLAGASSSLSDQEQMQRVNVVGTRRLLEAAQATSVERVLHMSTTAVYGEEVPLPSPVPEDVEPSPSRGYGKTKWEAEQEVWRAAGAGLPVVVVRPVSVYGPGNVKLLASAILDAAVERFAGLRTFAVHRVPIEQRLVHVADVVAACLHLVEHDAAVGRAFNVVLPQYPTSVEIAALLAAEFGLELEESDDPDCGPDLETRRATHERMLAQGMQERILLTKERLRFMRKANRNNRLSVDALLGTGFSFAESDLAGSIARTIAWYGDNRWIL